MTVNVMFVPDLRLDDRCTCGCKPFDFFLAVVGAEVEVDRVGLWPRLLAALKEKARATAVRGAGDVEAGELGLVHTRIAELLQKALVDLLVGPAEGVRPEPAQLPRLRAGERDIADVTMRRRLRRRLDAETVAFRIAHHGPGLFELPDAVRFRLDEMSTELEHSSKLRLAVGDVHVDVDRQLDRRRLRHPVEEEPGALPARIGRQPTVARRGSLVVQQPSPELREARRIVARKRDVFQAKHGRILGRTAQPSTRTPTLQGGVNTRHPRGRRYRPKPRKSVPVPCHIGPSHAERPAS